MKVIVIADDDGLVGHLENETADTLISLGDMWDSTINKARERYNCSTVFAVKGNHDSDTPFAPSITDLHFNITVHKGIVFGEFKGSWKYKSRGHNMFEQSEVEHYLRSFPAVDIFISHNSPAGIHERDNDVHQGFQAFTDYIDRTQPAYFIHGHQHVNKTTQRGNTTIIGVYGEAFIKINKKE